MTRKSRANDPLRWVTVIEPDMEWLIILPEFVNWYLMQGV